MQISRMHSKLSSERWILDQSSIFAQVDAFVQRCKDLLEVYKLCSVGLFKRTGMLLHLKNEKKFCIIRCEMSEWRAVLKLSLVDGLLL